jgi:hypothetical protein
VLWFECGLSVSPKSSCARNFVPNGVMLKGVEPLRGGA